MLYATDATFGGTFNCQYPKRQWKTVTDGDSWVKYGKNMIERLPKGD